MNVFCRKFPAFMTYDCVSKLLVWLIQQPISKKENRLSNAPPPYWLTVPYFSHTEYQHNQPTNLPPSHNLFHPSYTLNCLYRLRLQLLMRSKIINNSNLTSFIKLIFCDLRPLVIWLKCIFHEWFIGRISSYEWQNSWFSSALFIHAVIF